MLGSGEVLGHSASDSQRKNAAACLKEVRNNSPITLTNLARATGLSRPTVERILTGLIQQGLVGEVRPWREGAPAGRPARQYAFLGDSSRVMGVDFGIHRMRAVLGNLAGSVSHEIVWEIPAETDYLKRFDYFEEITGTLLRDAGIGPHSLANVVVAVPGVVSTTGDLLISEVLPELTDVNLATRFRERIGCPVIIENDINMAALGEHATGAGRLSDDMIYIQVGHRTNAALILGGKLRRGRHFATGEVGGLPASGWNRFGVDLGGLPSGDSAAKRFAQAEKGEPEAAAWAAAFARSLAPGVSMLLMAIDPDTVIIGGGVSGAGDLLLKPLRDAVAEVIPPHMKPQILGSAMGASSVALGGFVRGLEEAAVQLYSDSVAAPRIDLSGLMHHQTRRDQ